MTLGTLPPMTSGAMPFDITCWDMPLEQNFDRKLLKTQEKRGFMLVFLVQEKKASGVERIPSPQKSPVSRKSTDQWQTSMHHSGRCSGGEGGGSEFPAHPLILRLPSLPFQRTLCWGGYVL